VTEWRESNERVGKLKTGHKKTQHNSKTLLLKRFKNVAIAKLYKLTRKKQNTILKHFPAIA
jgi:hypothetical protein